MSVQSKADDLFRTAAIAKAIEEFNDDLSIPWPLQPDGIRDAFSPFFDMPKAHDFDPAISQVDAALHQISNGESGGLDNTLLGGPITANKPMAYVAETGDDTGKWEGAAAIEFGNVFKAPFDNPIRTNQFASLAVLRGALEAEAALWREAEKSVINLMDQTGKQLMAAVQEQGSDLAFGLSILAGVAAVAATIASGGLATPALAVTFTVVAGVSTSASVKASEAGPGGIPFLVVKSMLHGIEQIKHEITTAEQHVETALTKWRSGCVSNHADFVFGRSTGLGTHPGGFEAPQ